MSTFKTDNDDFGLEDIAVPGLTQPSEDSDLDITFIEEDDAPVAAAPRRGQNEGYAAEDENPDDYDDPRFQDRLNRERSQREAIERSSESELASMERALFQSERDKLEAQRDSFRLSLDSLDVRIATATEALKMARQEGDTSAETDLEARVSEYRDVRRQIEANMNRLPTVEALEQAFKSHIDQRRAERQRQRGAQSVDQDAVRPTNEMAAQWQQANSWMTQPSKAAERAAVLAINSQLVKEGLDANDPRFFVELSRRVAKTLPNVPVKDLSGRQLTAAAPSGQRSSAPPVAGARSASAPPSRPGVVSKSRVELTAADRSIMKALRIDTSNKDAVARYAREKLNRMRKESAGA